MKKQLRMMIAACLTAAALTACGSAPDSLEGTTWKLTSLTTPSGTEYDEAAYEMLVGETVYEFGSEGSMTTHVGKDDLSYSYEYEKGALKITSEDLECSGTVKRHEMRLQISENGEAVFTEVVEEHTNP